MNTLLKQNRRLFHTRDLALLWGIENKNTLYTTIKRYLKKGILIKIHKGFYSTVPLSEVDPVKLGLSYLHRYAYLTGEFILVKAGVIFQSSPYITFVSTISKKFELLGNFYLVRKLKDEYLYNDIGLVEENGIKKASLERVVADLLYFNPGYYFDSQDIDWKKVRKIQKKVGYI